MVTLFDKVKQGQIDQLDALDIALSLCCYIEDCDEFAHLDPQQIGLTEKNEVQIMLQDHPVDCFYAAPDVILDSAESSRESMYFSLGCMMFFMLTGRCYYDMFGLDPVDLACEQSGESMLDPTVYSDIGSDVICALTAWDPTQRREGVVKLLQIVETVPSMAVLEYICDDRVVFQENKQIQEDIADYRCGDTITGTDGAKYRVAPGGLVRFRPGTHSFKIPVVLTDDQSDGNQADGTSGETAVPVTSELTWLMMSFQNEGQRMHLKVTPLQGQATSKAIPISLLNKTRYTFYSVIWNESGPPRNKKELFYLDIPQNATMKRAYLSIRYHVNPCGFSVWLCDPTGKPISNSRHFKMN